MSVRQWSESVPPQHASKFGTGAFATWIGRTSKTPIKGWDIGVTIFVDYLFFSEVAPDPNQQFRCLSDRKCFVVVRGFGVGHFDALAVLPIGQNSCPPPDDILSSNDNTEDMPVVVQSEHLASLASSRLPIPEASFAAFELPDRVTLANGTHTVCYAPALASEAKSIDELHTSDFHHKAGVLIIGDSLLYCDFEEDVPEHMHGDLGETPLPCGFRNFRDRWQANLIWQLGSGATETSATGPLGDVTAELKGRGS